MASDGLPGDGKSMKLSRRSVLFSTAATVAVLGGAGIALAQTARPALPAPPPTPTGDTEWRHFAADQANTRYAPLDQINADNFKNLEVAWRFKTDALGARKEYQFEATPLLVKGRLFLTAGARRDAIALDAATGEMLWMHRVDEGQRALNAPRQLSGHGVSYWTDGVKERILYVTTGYQLVCLDAATGDPDPEFGVKGIVDLKREMDQDLDVEKASVGLHATPLIVKDVVVVGAAHAAGDVPTTRKNVKGYVRGFDVKTGKRLWIFHTIPKKGEFGYDTWVGGDAEEAGNMGVWAEMSADEELGLVYLPVELATGDYVGIYRRGTALFGESIVAVDYRTGVRKWHYQTNHHGLWDRDLPCAPILCDIPVNGRIVKALAQPTKQCFLFVLDRTNGKPIWPIPERNVEKGNVPGEWYSATQPIPSKPPAYDVQSVNKDTIIDFTPELHAEALKLISQFKTGTLYTPPSMSVQGGPWGSLLIPGSQGGTNWPGGAYDPATNTVFVFSKRVPQSFGIIENKNADVSDFAMVRGIAGTQVRPQIPMGAARGGEEGALPPGGAGAGPRQPALTVQGLPLMKPPYGTLTAISLRKADITWQVAHGETPDNIRNHPALKGLKIPRTGREGNLGPLATKSLVICGEAGFYTDPVNGRGAMLRAYDKGTGEEKGAVFMPAPQSGSPMTYMLGGRQYIVVAIGGGNYSGELLALRLPRDA
jgi:quinoprotein glucose dehydrogenase